MLWNGSGEYTQHMMFLVMTKGYLDCILAIVTILFNKPKIVLCYQLPWGFKIFVHVNVLKKKKICEQISFPS